MKLRQLPALHPAGVVAGALLTALGFLVAEGLLGPLLARRMGSPEEHMMGMVHRNLVDSYVEPPDRQWLMHRAVAGMLDGLQDPYTFFIGPEELTGLEEDSSGSFIGIGVSIDNRDGRVRYPVPGGPAEGCGLQPGDRFCAVDGADVRGATPQEISRLIKGRADTIVHLEMERADGSRYQTDVTRALVPRGTIAKVCMLDPQLGIGLIHIRSFARSTPEELDAALRLLQSQSLRALVLDLRYNIGGLLDAAVEVAARFLDGGLVCHLLERGSDQALQAREQRRADPKLTVAADLPLVVLINSLSASGSEVLAGALRDRGHAVLIGPEPSYGKGVFQQVHRYARGNFALKFTAGYYVTPAGRILEGHIDPERAGGLEPDLLVAAAGAEQEEVRNWLENDEPPPRYRAAVERLFPHAVLPEPRDQVLSSALRHLQMVLA